MIHQSLTSVLKELRLPTVRASYEELATEATRDTLSYEQYLLSLMEREHEVRRENRIERWTPKTGQWLRCELLINMSPQGGHHDKAKTTQSQFKV